MEEFINQLLVEQGVSPDLDPEVRQQLQSDLSERANDLINRRLLDAMSDEAVEQFNALIDNESTTPEQVQEFITAQVPNRDQVVAATLVEFRSLFLGDRA